MFLGAEGIQKKWKMRQAFTSPAYTTRWGGFAEGGDLSVGCWGFCL
ncbi:DUF4113 domain-containing protein [Microbulbifer sp. JMSA008]